ncbi:ferritin, heavy subunit-like [Talpa occidentalis]|uniref:ferritin, heavy subunit-like n=1 Tax=Talpa occidentalis TaxID=50954 RepID=UPI00188FE032|nr:ferritin, heavy subunit-like [Talpa occidentalis]
MASLSLLPEDCRVALNEIASFELNISDAYLSMACYYNEETGLPPFAPFFEDQAEVKREHAKEFLRYLRTREAKICLPVIKRPDIDNWGTGIQAIESALELENKLEKLLEDLKTLASGKKETNLLRFLRKFLDKQKRNINYLNYQLQYQKEIEKSAQQEEGSSTQPDAQKEGSSEKSC